MKPEILLLGGGSHCKSVIDVIELEDKYTIVGIIDKKELIGNDVLGYKIIDCDENISKYKSVKNALITVGQIRNAEPRIRLFNLCREVGFTMPHIVSPLAYISKYARLGDGTIIMHHALINAGARVGKNCIINTKALIEHDAVVEDNCHISTGAIINGGTVVKENSFFGSNAMAKEYIEIKAGSVVGGGVALLKSH
jgi:sugar O-acyltransferase (sialic acid O-acetyltransferase NeuD family)